MQPRRALTGGLARAPLLRAAALPLFALSAAGCVAHVHELPPEDAARLAAAHGFAGTCAVVDPEDADGTGHRVDHVRRTGLFTDVVTVPRSVDGADRDWVLSEVPLPHPVDEHKLTMLTLGIVPAVDSDERDHLWLATRPGHPDMLRVEWTSESTAIFGWIGLPLTLLPSWANISSDDDRQSRADRLGIELLNAGVGAAPR